jgi:hypothetical protein
MVLDREFSQVIDGLGEKPTDPGPDDENFHGKRLLTV